jgi:DNA-binding beta-propeller fold protein YncE
MSAGKKIISLICSATIAISAAATGVSALEAYDPYSYDRWFDPISSQAGYTAESFVDGNSIGCGAFSEPADIFVSDDDLIYIADKGNNRVVVTDLDFNLVNELKEFSYNGETLTLKKPSGVYVDKYTGFIYIADTENNRVIKCDKDGNVDRLFEKPDSEVYAADVTFNPLKILVDKGGNVYVIVQSITKGAVMYNSGGEFLGFYGANKVKATSEVIANAFWNLISTDEQRARTLKATPTGFVGFDIDDDGFIYTVTQSASDSTGLLKKLNPRGTNIIDSLGVDDSWIFGDFPSTYYSIYATNSSLSDIDIGPNGEINILDYAHGRVFQYDKECWLLFIVGGTGEQLGTFRNPTALESHDNCLYVVDSLKNNITVFERTAFGEIVTEATNLYNEGLYEESEQPWRAVLSYDGNYRRAYIGIGNALYNRGEYKEAMKYYKIANSQGRYNKAFQGYRDEWMRSNFSYVIAILLVIIVLTMAYKKLRKNGIIRTTKKRKDGA